MNLARAALLSLILVPIHASAYPDVNAVVRKMQTAAAAAKSYQATMLINVTMGRMGSMVMSMDIRMLPQNGKMHVKVSPTGQATGQMQLGVLMASMEAVDDGKYTYLYRPSQGIYQKGKHVLTKRDPSQFAMAGTAGLKFKFVRDDVLNGAPVMVVEAVRT